MTYDVQIRFVYNEAQEKYSHTNTDGNNQCCASLKNENTVIYCKWREAEEGDSFVAFMV